MSNAVDVVPFRIRMAISFRGLHVREGVLVRGPQGWGELSPFPDHPPYIVRRWLAATREAAFYGWPPPVREEVEVNATVPAVSADVAHGALGLPNGQGKGRGGR